MANITIDIDGDASKLESKLRNLENKKATVTVDANTSKAESQLKKLDSKKLKAQLDLDKSQVDSKINEIKRQIQEISNKKISIDAEITQDKNSIKAYQNQMSTIQSQIKKGTLSGDEINYRQDYIGKIRDTISTIKSGLVGKQTLSDEYKNQIKQLNSDIKDLQLDKKDLQVDFNIQNALSKLQDLENEMNNVGDEGENTAQRIQTAFLQIGQVLSTVGDTISKVSGMLGGDALYGGLKSVANSITSTLTGSLDDAISRYDTLTTFPQYMSMIGVSTEKSTQVLDNMYNSILGTKIKFDDIVEDARLYSMILGDVDKGSNLATTVNKLFTLGGSDANGQWLKTFQRLVTTGTLSQTRQWLTILNGMGAGAKLVAEQFESTGGSVRELSNQLTDGTISADQFLEVLGNMTTNGSLDKLTSISQSTIEGQLAILKNAVTVGETNLITGINEQLMGKGTSIQQILGDFATEIKGYFTELGTYIGQHPEIITNTLKGVRTLIDEVVKIVKDLGNKDIAGGIKNIFSGLKTIFSTIGDIASLMPINAWATIITWGPLVGKALSWLGSIFTAIGKFRFFRGLSGGGISTAMSGITSSIKSFKAIMQGTAVVGGGIALVAGLGATIKLYVSTIQDIANLDLGEDYSAKLSKVVSMVSWTSGIITAVSAIMGGITAATEGAGAVFMGIGEGLTLGLVSIIAGFAKTIQVFADAMQTISKIDINGLDSNKVDEVISAFNKISTVFVDKNIEVSFDTAEGIKNMSEGMKNIVEVIPQIQALQINAKKLESNLSAIENLIPTLANISNLISEKFQGDGLTQVATGINNSWLGSIVKIVFNSEDVANGIKGLETFSRQMEAIDNAFGSVTQMSNMSNKKALTKKVEDALNVVEEINKALDANEYKLKGGRVTQEGITSTRILAELENVQKVLGLMQSISDVFNSTNFYIDPEKLKPMEGGNSPFVTVLDQLFGEDGIINQIKGKLISTERGGFQNRSILKDFEDKNLVQSLQEMQKIFEGIGKIINTFNNMTLSIDPTKISPTENGGPSAIKVVMEQIFGQGGLLNTLTDYLYGEGWSDNKAIANLSKGNLDEKILSVKSIFDSIKTLMDTFNKMTFNLEVTNFEPFAKVIEQIFGADGIITKLNNVIGDNDFSNINDSVTSSFEQFKNIVNQLPEILNVFNSTDFSMPNYENASGAFDKINALMGKLQAGDGEVSIPDISTAFTSIANSINTISSDNIVVVGGAIENVASQAENAKGKVDELKSSIESLPDKEVQITANVSNALSGIDSVKSALASLDGKSATVTVNKVTTGSVDGGEVQGYATGGFVPRGTDTVPAMLTPGEYVIRRGVASVLGKSTLDKLNSMDIQGAMASLGMASIYKTYHTTNTYNNDNRSTTVIQNINNNSEEYSYARAGKFVERLGRL